MLLMGLHVIAVFECTDLCQAWSQQSYSKLIKMSGMLYVQVCKQYLGQKWHIFVSLANNILSVAICPHCRYSDHIQSVTLYNIYTWEVSVDMKLVWSIISAKIGAYIIQVITIGHTMVNLGTIRFLHIVRFHEGCFLFRKWFEEIAFCSKDDFKWTVSTVKR